MAALSENVSELVMMTVNDVSELLQVSPRTIWRYLDEAEQSGFPRPIALNGRTLRWKKNEVLEYINKQERR
jgi:predicted DNA-binding transcriptional regulator AlpA